MPRFPYVFFLTSFLKRAALKAAGWIVSGRGYDVASDEPTHTGRGFDALYLDFYGRETNA